LNADGVTANDANDADGGPNQRQNYPVLLFASISGPEVVIAGTLDSTAARTLRIEFFASSAGDASGYGEGQRYLGYVDVTTDAAGDASFVAPQLRPGNLFPLRPRTSPPATPPSSRRTSPPPPRWW
jgi:hypothetical protein